MKVCFSETLGTFFLVFIGTGAFVIGGFSEGSSLDQLAIGLTFGFALIAAIYSFGSTSGAHLNPAVTLGFYCSGRMNGQDVIPYFIYQIIGGILASLVLWLILMPIGSISQEPSQIINFASNGWDESRYNILSVFLAEAIATFIFVMVILSVTAQKHMNLIAGLVIGLTLAALHFVFIPISGSSLNPARSIGPALFSGKQAMMQLWLYLVAPMVGGAFAGLMARMNLAKEN